MGNVPILIGSMGEKLGMPIVAEHADIWHLYGELDLIAQKITVMKELLDKRGRDHSELEISTNYFPGQVKTGDPDSYLELGISSININVLAPDWDFGLLRELIQWRDGLNA